MILYTTISIGLVLALAGVGDQSLPEHAKRHGGKAENDIILHFDVMTIEELVAKADSIVFCRIEQVRPHLTPDERHVVTDYQISPIRVFKQE